MKAIIVFYDTLIRDLLPPYNPEAETIAPNFCRLARHSVQFDNCYIGSVPCIPARRELHTGRYNFLHREWGPIEPFDDSMPEILKKNGVYTHLISDHLHYWEDGGATYHTRYSSWEIVRGQEGEPWKGEVAQPEIPPVLFIPQKMEGQGASSLWRHDWVNRKYINQSSDFPGNKVFDLGCEFIEKNQSEDNWLLQIETFNPHEPFFVPKEYLDLYQDTYNGDHFDWPRGRVAQSPEAIDHIGVLYRALVTMCDTNLGRVLDMMDKYDMWNDTMLIVGTDHGFSLGEREYWGKNILPNYNEIAHIPLFIWDPREKICDETRDSLVQLIDWAPTLLDFFNVTIPQDMQGKPLDNVIRSDEPIRDHAFYGVFSGHINVTDAHHTFFKAPLPEKVNDIYNYTLMPLQMKKFMSIKDLQSMELVKPFSFTKGCPVLKIKAKEKYRVHDFGSLLFNIDEDPNQTNPIENNELQSRFERKIQEFMVDNEAPIELYERFGYNTPDEKE